MLPRRRNALPPYEVMGGKTGKFARSDAPSPMGGPAPTPEPAVVSRAPLDHGGADAGASGWNTPVVLRLPRGIVAAGLLALVVLLGLTYWVGKSRGRHLEQAQDDAQRDADSTAIAAAQAGAETVRDIAGGSRGTPAKPGGPSPSGTSSGAGKPTPGAQGASPRGTQSVVPAAAAGQRQPGLFYFVLVTTPSREGADSLATFLRENGVDARAFPVHNESLYQVLALRGFPKDQLQSEERRKYQESLSALGRKWKARSRGNSDLHDMYPEQYKGEPAPKPNRNATR